jgi:glucosylceramidase
MPSRLVKASLCCLAFCLASYSDVAITGTVTDQTTQTPIQGAVVSLAASGLTCVTDSNGKYSFGANVAVGGGRSRIETPPVRLAGSNRLEFGVANSSSPVRIELYALSGRLIAVPYEKRLPAGNYRLNLAFGAAASQPCLLRVRIGNGSTILRVPFLGAATRANMAAVPVERPETPGRIAKAAAAADTILAWAVGYGNAALGIDNLTGTYDVSLQRIVPSGQALVLQSSQTADKVSQKPSLTFADDDGSALPTITVTPSATYQSIVGFGAAFTETSVYNLAAIGAAKKSRILNAFFNPYIGAGYTLCRSTINSCDFSLGLYAYDETAGDYNLTGFDIAHDRTLVIPTIKEAMTVPGANFRIFGSPWSPPAWMKSNGSMLNGGQLKSDCFAAWALYYVKYVDAMRDNGITIWGLTVQNEPWATQTWESCIYTSQQERDFVKNYLGPTLARNNVTAKLMIWDHNKDILVERATTVLSDTAAAKYVYATAYHHYAGDYFDNMNTVHDDFPQKLLIGTENSVHAGFSEVERMAHEIIGDLNHWSSGYLTWNLVTDLNGGPYHARTGGVPGDILVDSASGAVTYTPNYYYMTHFSKYMRPGAVRIGCAYTGTNLEAAACRNTNGVITVAVLNKTANAVDFKLKQGTRIVKQTIPGHSLMDILY